MPLDARSFPASFFHSCPNSLIFTDGKPQAIARPTADARLDARSISQSVRFRTQAIDQTFNFAVCSHRVRALDCACDIAKTGEGTL